MEPYVSGNLQDALLQIERIRSHKNTEKIGNIFEYYFPHEEINEQVEDTLLKMTDKAHPVISDMLKIKSLKFSKH
ncbi:hypothetical protein [Chryseobacterium sp. 7]|uniref:hypothetical protein n=1 Tax=Chryseobacterium sp. 7 TaxID=2035214 RepID=UPI000EB04E1F|nr:hypothetical protein [Chryseobacterium sp. 7]